MPASPSMGIRVTAHSRIGSKWSKSSGSWSNSKSSGMPEGAEHHLAGVFLVIGAFIGHAQHRQGAEARDRLGDDVEMLAGLQRHVDAQHRAQLAAPHAGAVDHVFGLDMAGASVL